MTDVATGLDLTPHPGGAPLGRQVLTQASMEARLMLRNGEQLLLAVVIPVLILVGGVTAGKHLDLKLTDPRPLVDIFTPGVIALAVMSTSFTSLAIATDNVDKDQLRTPRRWDIGFVRRFMVVFGLVSSAFDFVTFGFLILFAAATAQNFQTAWFVESLVTELAIVLVVRTRKAFWQSRPSALLWWLTVAVGLFAIAIPYLPGAAWFGFEPLSMPVMGGLELTRSIRRAAVHPDRRVPNPQVPVVIITGHRSEADVQQARRAGVNEFVIKPFTPAGLLSRIQLVLMRPRPFVVSEDYIGPDRRRLNAGRGVRTGGRADGRFRPCSLPHSASRVGFTRCRRRTGTPAVRRRTAARSCAGPSPSRSRPPS